MSKRALFKSLFTCFVCVALFGCGSAEDPSTEATAGSVLEAVSPVNTIMYVRRDTIPPGPTQTLIVLSEDPLRPTPALTQVTVLKRTSDIGNYSTSADQAVAAITASEWANMAWALSSPTEQVQVGITYDSSVSGTTKPLIGGPTFTLVSP